MFQLKAHGTFEMRGINIYRTSAFIQWGDSDQSLGACLLLNPGSASLDVKLMRKLERSGVASGSINIDPTMEQLIKFLEKINSEQPISGRLYIYNLFTLKNTKSQNAMKQLKDAVATGEYKLTESLVASSELRKHPWILLGWGVDKFNHLGKQIKDAWLERIRESGIRSFGKKHVYRDDYYHPCPLIPTKRPLMLEDLVNIYNQEFRVQRFTVYATKPNLLVNTESKGTNYLHELLNDGWQKSLDNPEILVKSFSNLRIRDGYKLRAYQFLAGGNGNGIVWAIPIDKELPDPESCDHVDDFISSPRPNIALSDFMSAIEGDQTPLSYIQASVVYHELHEFGALWHGVSWGRDQILPLNEDSEVLENDYDWDMNEPIPDIIEPNFYYNSKGNPVVIFYTINDIGQVTLNRYVHTFNKENYTLDVKHTVIAEGGSGIIF
ncbi:hypothetical protein ABWW58_09285 [Sporolactobacillus sp. STCC-11]|uniref:hypothetical protein n=1 Tax=Sporolactobacillus caesalpiniae TaxID=3230362 RepID=UPI0033922524